jgi:hypothetical protein
MAYYHGIYLKRLSKSTQQLTIVSRRRFEPSNSSPNTSQSVTARAKLCGKYHREITFIEGNDIHFKQSVHFMCQLITNTVHLCSATSAKSSAVCESTVYILSVVKASQPCRENLGYLITLLYLQRVLA